LSGPPTARLFLPFDLCVSVTRVVHIPPAPWRPALVGRLGPGVVPFGLPAFDLGTFVLEILLFLPRLLGSWSVYGSCLVYCSVRRYIVFRIPHRHYPGSPCLHLARGLPRPLTLPVLPRFLFSFYSWIFLSALLLILLVLPRPSLARCACVSRNACSTFPRLRTYSHCSLCLRVPP
jgi:hypothetical protein